MTVEKQSVRARVFAATWLSYAGFYVTRKVFSVVKGPLRDALHTDDLGVSHLFTAYLVTYMLGQFASAWLSRRVANRTLLLGGMLTSVACNLALGALTRDGAHDAHGTFAAMMLVMGAHGFAQATGWPCNVGIMARWTRRHERGRVMALWGTCYQLGAVVAKALAAFLFGALGLLWSFTGTALVLLAITGLFALWAKEKPAHAFDDDEPTDPGAIHSRHPEARMMALVLAMGVIYFAFKFLRYALDSWSALILAEHFSLSTARAGYLSTAFDWIGFLGVIAAGWASDRAFGGKRAPVMVLMTWGTFAACALLWTYGLSSWIAFAALLGAVGFMAMGPDSLLAGSAAMDVGSQRQAALAAGIVNGCGSIGPIVQEPVIGWLKTRAGDGGDAAVLGLLVAITSAAAVAMTAFFVVTRRAGMRI